MKPNILMVVLDTARADAFEPYGAPAGSSPVIGDLAREGGRAARAYAPSCWTVPSHVGMFTGQLARSVGLGQAPDGSFRSTRPRMQTLEETLLPTVLRSHGYTTAGVSCNAWISPSGGWDLGFDEFTHVPSPRSRPHGRFSRQTARWLREVAVAEVDNGGRNAERVMTDWFDRWDGTKPFFWFANLMECHGPYLPPAPYNDLGVVQRLLAGRDSLKYQPFEAVLRQNLVGIDASAASMARMRHLYARSIKVLDDWLGRMLGVLERAGVLDDTAIVITADHGENFGECGLIGHGYSLDDRLVHIPMVTRGPIANPGDESWSLLGLPALLCDAAGIESPPYEHHLAGQPAPAQFDPLASSDDERILAARDRWSLDDDQVRVLADPLTMVTNGLEKLVRHGEHTWFHDLATDPLEATRLPAAQAPEALHDALAADRLWATVESVIAGADPASGADPDEVEALEEQMRLLGYI